jgi:hypothetical protein
MSKIKVNSIEAATGSTITIPSGQTLDISSTTLTLPSTVVTTTGTQTLTNKTIGVSQLSGTLPVANGGTGLTTLGSASQVLRVNSGATALEFGSVVSGLVQMKQVVYSTQESLACDNADTNSGLTISITPTSASNKILVTGMIAGGVSGGFGGFGWVIKRGGTDVSAPASGGTGAQFRYHSQYGNPNSYGDGGQIQTTPIHFLDSPSTTSSITYTLVARGVSGVSSVTINRNGNDTQQIANSYLTVMEISGGIIV